MSGTLLSKNLLKLAATTVVPVFTTKTKPIVTHARQRNVESPPKQTVFIGELIGNSWIYGLLIQV